MMFPLWSRARWLTLWLTACGVAIASSATPARTETRNAEPRNIWEDNTIWIEDSPKAALVIRFGVFGKVAETSPGNLDRLLALAVWKPQGAGRPAPLRLNKAADHFLVQGADAKTSIQAEDLSVMARHDEAGGYLGRKPVLYARWQPVGPVEQTPRLTLDIVPAEKPDDFRVFFRGRPLAGAKVRALGPPGLVPRELETNSDGTGSFTPSGPGLYQLACSHTETAPVYVVGVAYKGVRHMTTLTWRQP